jgi:hypothetical protein
LKALGKLLTEIKWFRLQKFQHIFSKNEIGSTELSFLGIRLTPKGIVPREDHLKALQQALPPSSVQEIRQFLGMSKYYFI